MNKIQELERIENEKEVPNLEKKIVSEDFLGINKEKEIRDAIETQIGYEGDLIK